MRRNLFIVHFDRHKVRQRGEREQVTASSHTDTVRPPHSCPVTNLMVIAARALTLLQLSTARHGRNLDKQPRIHI